MKLSLAPLPYPWPEDEREGFYLRVADEADIDTVFLGEIACPKRPPISDRIRERLEKAGKEVIPSTPVLPAGANGADGLRERMPSMDPLMEANDMSAVAALRGRPHTLGPFLPIHNTGALRVLAEGGAIRACLPFDLPGHAIAQMAAGSPIPLEVQVFGHAPLAISARCFSAHATRRLRKSCQLACLSGGGRAMDIGTLEGSPFLRASGPLVLSARCTSLLREIPRLAAMGISALRIQPESCAHPADVARLVRSVLSGEIAAKDAQDRIQKLAPGTVFCNGFFHNHPGHKDIPE